MNKIISYNSFVEKSLIILVCLPILLLPLSMKGMGLVYIDKPIILSLLTIIIVIMFLQQAKYFKAEYLKSLKTIKIFNIASISLVISTGLSFAFSKYKTQAFFGILPNFMGYLAFLVSPLFVYVTLPAFKNINKKKVLAISYISFSILSIIIHIQYFYKDFLYCQPANYNLAFHGGLGNRNYASSTFCFLFILSFVSILTTKSKREKYLLFIPFSLFYSIILISLTRGAWVALFAVAVVFFIYTMLKKPEVIIKQKTLILLIISLMLLIFFIVNIFGEWTVYSRIFKTINEINSGESLNKISSKRTDIWSVSLRLTKKPKTFLIGTGPYNFYLYLTEKDFPEKITSIHNQYIESLVATGILGLLSFIIFILTIFYYSIYITVKEYENIGFFLCIVYLITSLIFISINATNFIYFLIIIAEVTNKYMLIKSEDKVDLLRSS